MAGFICGTGRTQPKHDNAPIKKNIGPTNPNVREWETNEVLEWLQKIGKSEYQSKFQHNNINGKKLLSLNNDSLKTKLGVTDGEDRKQIKKEISKLKNSDGGKIHKQKSNISSNSQPLENGHHNNNNNHHNNNINGNHNNNNNNNQLSKSQSAYLAINGNHGGGGIPSHNPREVEFPNQPPYGRVGFDSDTFANDKKQDKQQYFQYWQTILRGNSDILLKTQYDIIMNGSKLPQQDKTLIWQLATHYNQGRCTFEQFADIIKLTFIALSGVPLYLLNTQKLIWFHPPVPVFIQNYQPPPPPQAQSGYVDMIDAQRNKNTVAFRGLPQLILESDEKLMKFAELALHNFEPVHFEINENTLIATFRVPIQPPDLAQLRAASVQVCQNQFGIVHINGRNLMSVLEVDFPNAQELGLTPGGPGPQGPPMQQIPQQGRHIPPQQQHPHQQIQHQHQPHHDMYNNNNNNNNLHGTNGHMNSHMNNINPNQGYMGGSQYSGGYSNPNIVPQQHDPYSNQIQQNNNPSRSLPPPPGPGPQQHNQYRQQPMSNPNMNGSMIPQQPNGYPNNGMYPPQQQPQQQQRYGNQMPPQQQQTPDITPREMSHAKKQEFIEVLLSENFWEEFRIRSNIDNILPNDDTKIRTKAAMQILASLRQVPQRTINYLDKGVKELQGTTKGQLRQEINSWTMIRLALLLDIPENDIPEVYKGIIIEGLPDQITQDDDTIRKLDGEVLFTFIVSHIEVVDNVLRITFKKDVSQADIDKLRRGLKTFLKDVMKLEKKLMKNVSLIPHTRDTWRDQTTTSEYDDVGMDHYGNEV